MQGWWQEYLFIKLPKYYTSDFYFKPKEVIISFNLKYFWREIEMYRYDNDEPLSIGGWIGTLLVMAIPIVNLVMIFVWGFGNGNTSRKNFALAYLIIMLLSTAVFIIIFALSAGSMTQMFYDLQNLQPY